MSNSPDHRRATADAFRLTDDAWQNALIQQFGRKASDIRYTPQGAGEPGSELRRLYSDRYRAYVAWAELRGMSVVSDPLCEPARADKSPGQLAYEADCAAEPTYHDGTPRKAWSDLCAATRDTWHRDPTPKPRARMVQQQSQQQQARDARHAQGILSPSCIPERRTSPFHYERWRHGGWYVSNVRHPSGAVGCVSRNYTDGKWRIVCDPRPNAHELYTYRSRDEAAQAEADLIAAGHGHQGRNR